MKTCIENNRGIARTRYLMNTFCTVQAEAGDPAITENIIEEVFAELKRVENTFSRFRHDSQISWINQRAGNEAVRVDSEVLALIAQGPRYSKETFGAFDIAQGAAIDFWRSCEERGQLPTARELEDLKNRIGNDKVHLDMGRGTIRFSDPGVRIDLGAVAKGYALNRAVLILQRHGVSKAQVNLGGHIYVLNTWPQLIGIRDPRFPDRIAATVKLMNSSISTSANYERFFEIGNKRFGHLLNPLTGYPAQTDILSASVVSQDAILVDALSTAIFILGFDKGRELVNRINGVESVVICKRGFGNRVKVLKLEKERRS